MVHLMSAGRLRYLRARREGPEDADVPAALRGRRRARAHRGGREAARRRLAAAAGRARGGARAPRPRGRRARRGVARPHPRLRLAAAALAAARPAADRRHRPRVGERDPPRCAMLSPYALSTQLDDEEIERLADGDPLGDGARHRAADAGRSEPGRLPRARPPRRAVLALRHPARARRLRGAHDLLLPGLPDRGPRAQGPPALPGCCDEDRAGHAGDARARGDDRATPAAALGGAHTADARASSSRRSTARRCCSRFGDEGQILGTLTLVFYRVSSGSRRGSRTSSWTSPRAARASARRSCARRCAARRSSACARSSSPRCRTASRRTASTAGSASSASRRTSTSGGRGRLEPDAQRLALERQRAATPPRSPCARRARRGPSFPRR